MIPRIHVLATAALAVFSPFATAAPRGAAEPVPDFTKGDPKGESHDWNLGATGARGWMYGKAGHTADSRQILITGVAPGSPAADTLRPGDVILGVGGKQFDDDARIAFAKAVTAAEAEGGKLELLRWREGKSESVTIPLAVLGPYSDTAPYDSEKSKLIFDKGCEVIASRGLKGVSIPNSINALALLAANDPKHQPLLQDYAKQVADYHAEGFASWFYGHALQFLAEYVVTTGDTSVMKGVERIAREIAEGQSAVGTWGHRFARPSGNCNGYGCMNLPGLGLMVAMVSAREAGVKDPVVDEAIAKGAAYLRWYVDKGAIPYGDHLPWPGHEDNGKCSAAAVLFDLLGDREAATYFAAMSAAAYAERERGHTGNFYNMLWAMPGVSRCGPVASGAYWKEQGWYYDLARSWDGSFGYQGSPVGEEEHNKYTRWDSTGAYLLTYALPLKSLLVTGKKPSVVPPFSAADTADVIVAGRDYFSSGKGRGGYQDRSTEELLNGLTSWSPAVRKRSAKALGKQGSEELVPTLLKMIDSDDHHARYGACEALGELGPKADAAGARLRELLKDSDPWMQSLACGAIPNLGPEQRKASVPDLLAMTARVNPADPRRMAHRAACAALFAPYPGAGGPRSLLAESIEGIDRDLLYPAIESALQNDDPVARGSVAKLYGKLSDEDLVRLLPSILKAVDLAPSNEMFGDGVRISGLDLLSRLHIREAIPLCVTLVEPDRWGAGKRLKPAMKFLARYGDAAKDQLPELKKMRAEFVASTRRREDTDEVRAIDAAIAEIESAGDAPTLISIRDFRGR
ncbi:PBS lyase heat-containing protein [Haloferula helveola]|uniref:PBS lyase heat-containing protein n=1 Tax=Haloferula helveola TaxID=490095 RepID=A0ABN6H797_9BACT|nr:PBS lyase heat-containing protein [Haloferula helveola]